MKKKTTKKAKPAGKPRSVEQVPAAPAPVMPAAAVTTTTNQPPSSAPAPKPALARTRLRTPAQRTVAELIRFLKIHQKTPYARRGQRAILDLAQRATRQAEQEQKTLLEVVPMHNRTFVETALARLQQEQPAQPSTAAAN
jgi:hypothetical protein